MTRRSRPKPSVPGRTGAASKTPPRGTPSAKPPTRDASADAGRTGAASKTPPRGTPSAKPPTRDASADAGRTGASKTPPRGTPTSKTPPRGTPTTKTPPRGTPTTKTPPRGTALVAPARTAAIARPAGTRAKAAAEKVVASLARTATAGVAQKAARELAGSVSTIAGAGATAAAQHQIASATSRDSEARRLIALADERHMRRALEVAEQYRGRTAPNPIVGCVIVDARGDVIAEGAHRGPGTKHAEIDALDQLGGTAPGGTLYVNLEPCTHQGRTPPCMPRVAAAKLARIVVGSLDPIAAHAGGAKKLAKQGLPVLRVLVDECDLANLAFTTASLTRRAAFTLKAAVTLDGKIATVGGESKWITGEAAREHVHRLRSRHDAVLVGIGTVLADDPQLTARIEGGRDPVRIVVDSELRTPPTAKLLPSKQGPRTIIATTETASETNGRALAAAGAEVWRFPASGGKVSLGDLASRLAEESLYSVLVEGGGEIHAALLAEGLATELQLFVAPRIVGGPSPSWVGGAGIASLAEAWQLQFVGEPRRIGEDLLLRAVVRTR